VSRGLLAQHAPAPDESDGPMCLPRLHHGLGQKQVVAVYLSRSRMQHQHKLMLPELVGDRAGKIVLAELTVDGLTGT